MLLRNFTQGRLPDDSYEIHEAIAPAQTFESVLIFSPAHRRETHRGPPNVYLHPPRDSFWHGPSNAPLREGRAPTSSPIPTGIGRNGRRPAEAAPVRTHTAARAGGAGKNAAPKGDSRSRLLSGSSILPGHCGASHTRCTAGADTCRAGFIKCIAETETRRTPQ